MLGVAVLHMVPHAWHDSQSIDRVVRWLLAGFVVMFFIQRFFHFHHHDVPDDHLGAAEESPPEVHGHSDCEHHHEHSLAQQSARQLSWGGAALGLSLHSLIDGIALAASVQAESHGTSHAWLVGFGTFTAVILHKPFDSMAIGALMAAGGGSRAARHLMNFIFALATPLGVLCFYIGLSRFAGEGQGFLGAALAFTAGTFLCIAASDLLPELQFHSHDRGKLSVALVAGLVLSALLGNLEAESHGHERDPNPAPVHVK